MAEKSTLLIQGILAGVIIILSVFWKPEAFLFLFLLMLIPPVLRALKISGFRDEHSAWIDFQSGYFIFYMLYGAILFIFFHKLFISEKNPETEWYLLLFLPVILRMIYIFSRKGETRKLGLILGTACGAFWLLFTILSHGLQEGAGWEYLIGGSILVFTGIGWFQPLVGAIFLNLSGLAFFVRIISRVPAENPATQILMTLLLPLPPIVAGIAFLLSRKKEAGDEFADFRNPADSDMKMNQGANGGVK